MAEFWQSRHSQDNKSNFKNDYNRVCTVLYVMYSGIIVKKKRQTNYNLAMFVRPAINYQLFSFISSSILYTASKYPRSSAGLVASGVFIAIATFAAKSSDKNIGDCNPSLPLLLLLLLSDECIRRVRGGRCKVRVADIGLRWSDVARAGADAIGG
jgi:hypothetical protein